MTNLETITKMIADGQMDDSALESVVKDAKSQAWYNAIVDTANKLHAGLSSEDFLDEDAINYELNEICVSETLGFFYGDIQDPDCKIKVIPSIKQDLRKGIDNSDEAMDSWAEWLAHFQMTVVNHMIASDRFYTEFETKGYKEFSYKRRAK